ncbi:MAG: hypothetical protein ACO1SX_06745 [Actinomycetota bacterium]
MKREQTLYSQVLRRGWLQRTIRLSGEVEAIIEYNAAALGIGSSIAAKVRVNGQEVVASQRGSVWGRHRLLLPAIQYGLTPILEIEFTKLQLAQLQFFRLTVGSEVLYEENRGTVVRLLEPPPLPIPALTPPPDPADLPIASQLTPE